MQLTIKDVEILQQNLAKEQEDYQIELQEGNLLVMGPSDIESSEIGAQLIHLLKLWVNPRNLGRIFDSSGGFIMPNTDLRAPDVSFVVASRLKRTVRDFGNLVPDLVVEIKSKTDRIGKLEDKVKLFLEQGAKIGILINPDERTVSVYRPNGEIETLTGDDKLTIPELFPGWEINISEIWPPVFE
ncbi:Uma2 family endonuclease [Sphaerospermopsis sp. FACHB-1194]|uniref:Uma2 family endonuclease n=1 Tax=Sphaerospermopsis sp. FACHB-1194 TaxID=2692862 RepID=UPI001681074F|nr:Uma2 family endonuclease [Sphaerospermopsis sp. FACHB-1194]MBD2147278.1 Uma2 family endonuclease [Sphaerospermopsis sp. FACHB-1194]